MFSPGRVACGVDSIWMTCSPFVGCSPVELRGVASIAVLACAMNFDAEDPLQISRDFSISPTDLSLWPLLPVVTFCTPDGLIVDPSLRDFVIL